MRSSLGICFSFFRKRRSPNMTCSCMLFLRLSHYHASIVCIFLCMMCKVE
jgi:hypothetical protein